jgi:hypothetical protein
MTYIQWRRFEERVESGCNSVTFVFGYLTHGHAVLRIESVENRLVLIGELTDTSIPVRYCRQIDRGQCAIKSDDPRILRGNIGTNI